LQTEYQKKCTHRARETDKCIDNKRDIHRQTDIQSYIGRHTVQCDVRKDDLTVLEAKAVLLSQLLISDYSSKNITYNVH